MTVVRLLVAVSVMAKLMVLVSGVLASGGAEKPAAKAEGPGAEKKIEAAPRREPEAVNPELLARSRGFRELLVSVDERSAELARREKALADRETALKALEQTVTEQVTRLEALTAPASGSGPAAPVPGDTRGAVSKIYESMKAEEAAPILDRMDETTVREILSRMKERQIGAILAAMSKDRAVAVTKAMADPKPPAAPTGVASKPVQ